MFQIFIPSGKEVKEELGGFQMHWLWYYILNGLDRLFLARTKLH
jgi:hypothetical protein